MDGCSRRNWSTHVSWQQSEATSFVAPGRWPLTCCCRLFKTSSRHLRLSSGRGRYNSLHTQGFYLYSLEYPERRLPIPWRG
ncbi:hypothetical protein E2C01_073574 [Portunus trituberculatus]|uniref:Uncharacterized protein n=1 Tax=Portunus trituberculatus TaxID=210409 RepID=A0A5B7I5P8_PORTR|nr:hypothetical protein [Portunus trituberculatus]